MSNALNVSSSYTPYGTTDRRYTHQASSNGTDANNRNTGGRNTLQSNASLIMKQNGTSSSTNIGRAGVSAAHATPTHVSNKATSNNENAGNNDAFWRRNNQIFDRGSRTNNI